MAVSVDVEKGVAVAAYARAEARNSFDVPAVRELHRVVRETLARDDVRALVLTGHGDAFCAGADVKAFPDDPEASKSTILALTAELHPLVRLLHEGPKPVVTAVNGVAAGGGFGLALAGDLRIAAANARFTPAYFRIGLTPDGGLTHFLSRYAGLAYAQRVLLTNATVDAEEALAHGLVHRVVTPADLLPTAREEAQRLAAWSAASLAGTKRLLAEAWTREAVDQMEEERQTIALAGASPGFREGVAAFREKRAPRFP